MLYIHKIYECFHIKISTDIYVYLKLESRLCGKVAVSRERDKYLARSCDVLTCKYLQPLLLSVMDTHH